MLIKVFGIWLMASNITFLVPMDDSCRVRYMDYASDFKNKSCDQVGNEINKQIKEQANDR